MLTHQHTHEIKQSKSKKNEIYLRHISWSIF